jgi:hypothetical protein
MTDVDLKCYEEEDDFIVEVNNDAEVKKDGMVVGMMEDIKLLVDSFIERYVSP